MVVNSFPTHEVSAMRRKLAGEVGSSFADQLDSRLFPLGGDGCFCLAGVKETTQGFRVRLHGLFFSPSLSLSLMRSLNCAYSLSLSLSSIIQLVAVNLVDSHCCSDPGTFVSVLLTSLSSMVQMELPHINILSKIDLLEKYGKLRKLGATAVVMACPRLNVLKRGY